MFFWSDWGSRPHAQVMPMSYLPFAPILQQPQSQKVSLLNVRRKSLNVPAVSAFPLISYATSTVTQWPFAT